MKNKNNIRIDLRINQFRSTQNLSNYQEENGAKQQRNNKK